MGLSAGSGAGASMRKSLMVLNPNKQKERDLLWSSMSKCLEKVYVPKIDRLRSKVLVRALSKVPNCIVKDAFKELKRANKA